MEKIYLGLSVSHNSSACLYSNERGLLAAISQERLNSEKNTKELPFDAAIKCCEIANVKEIYGIAISHYENITDEYFIKHGSKYKLSSTNWKDMIIEHLLRNDITIVDKEIHHVHHHYAHALSTFAFYGRPKDREYYLITSDGFGDGFSAMIIDKGKMIANKSVRNSVGLVYQFVTGALGFTELKHEGKITGLAAFGQPIYLEAFGEMKIETELTEEETKMCITTNIVDFADFLLLKRTVYNLVAKLISEGATYQDIAASVQEYAEICTISWIINNCEPNKDVYLSGGLFANVKINQRIKDLKDKSGNPFFKNVYVCPAMGDEGTAVGAALLHSVEYPEKPMSPSKCGTICTTDIGTEYDDESLSKYIAEKLSENKIVCLVRGEMEFGPRALCHRSILYNCDSRETNDWLNKKLGRTEFMPFAPVCREEVADDLFKNLDGGRDSAKWMTMTFDCTEEFIQNYPAACHIDNTARPQVISYDDDPFMWKVLEHYQTLTNKKALINTSFNLHNNPIIESEVVAIDSWRKSDTDVLVIGNRVIEK